jgi:hypothetical protein
MKWFKERILKISNTKTNPEELKMALRIGQFAPDFSLESQLGEKVRLSDFRGRKNVVIAFFPLAFTPI